jgi:hypothetical protein
MNQQYGGSQEDLIAIGVMLTIMGVAILISLAISLVICFLLYSVQKRVPAEHREIEPGLVWLLLIPLFNIIWNFFVFLRIPESYQNYFRAQGRVDTGDCGRGVGLALAICGVCSMVPCVNYIAGPAYLVLLIIFLVKAWDLRSRIPATAAA